MMPVYNLSYLSPFNYKKDLTKINLLYIMSFSLFCFNLFKGLFMKFYSVYETATILNLNRNTIYSKLRRGELEYYKSGRKYLISEDHIMAFLANKTEENKIKKELLKDTNTEEIKSVPDLPEGSKVNIENNIAKDELANSDQAKDIDEEEAILELGTDLIDYPTI